MNEKTKTQGHELFEQAMKNYEHALQAGLKLQQESAKWWVDMMTQAGAPQDWQAKVNELASESVSMVQKRTEENLKLVEQSSRASLDLLGKAMNAMKMDTTSASQSKMQELWEASLEAVRTNATAVSQANMKWAESWMHMIPKAKGSPSAKAA